MLEPFQTHKDVILEDENALVLIFLLYFECHILFQYLIICLVDETERPLT